MTPTRAQIRQIIAECAGVAIERVVPEARLRWDLRLYNGDRAVIADAIEAECDGMVMGDDAIESWHTVSDIYETVERLSKEEGRGGV